MPSDDTQTASLSVRPRAHAAAARRGLLLFCAGLVALLVALFALERLKAGAGQPLSLHRVPKIPRFEMRNQLGETRGRDDYLGRVLIVDFFYASCPTSCPRLTAQMDAFRHELKARAQASGQALPVHLISITLDPVNDTPEALKAYAARLGVGPDEWSFLSGRSEDLNRVVVDGFKMHFEKVDPSLGLGSIMHGEWFVLVDKAGRIRGYYQIGEAERMQQLVEDAEALSREVGA